MKVVTITFLVLPGLYNRFRNEWCNHKKKSGYLETEAKQCYGEIENSNEVADFVRCGGSSRNRNLLHISGLNILPKNESLLSRTKVTFKKEFWSIPFITRSNSFSHL